MDHYNSTNATTIIYLEGNIGAGKSTLLTALKEELLATGKYDRYTLLSEPVDEWRNVNGTDVLRAFYRDPRRWSFLLNVHALNTLVERQQSIYDLPTTNHRCFLERSGRTTNTIFMPYAHQTSQLSDAELLIFNNIWKFYQHHLHVDRRYREITIYLRTSPTVCYERLRTRDNCIERESRTFSLHWHEALHRLHDQWLYPLRPIILNGDRPLSELVRDILILFP